MRISLLLILLWVLSSYAFPLRIGPSITYLIPGSGTLGEMQSLPYEQSLSSILFCNSELFLIGLQITSSISEDYSINIAGHWQDYDPHHITQPEYGHYSLDRSGSLALYSLGIQRSLGDFNAKLCAEAYYFSESWNNPYTGIGESIDSLAFGPAVNIAAAMELSPGVFEFGMGLTFPEFSNVWGMISLSFLLP